MVTNWFLYFLPTRLFFGSKWSKILFFYLVATITASSRKTNWFGGLGKTIDYHESYNVGMPHCLKTMWNTSLPTCPGPGQYRTTLNIATHSTDIIFAVCVAFFWGRKCKPCKPWWRKLFTVFDADRGISHALNSDHSFRVHTEVPKCQTTVQANSMSIYVYIDILETPLFMVVTVTLYRYSLSTQWQSPLVTSLVGFSFINHTSSCSSRARWKSNNQKFQCFLDFLSSD